MVALVLPARRAHGDQNVPLRKIGVPVRDRLTRFVYVATVSYSENKDHKPVFVNFVDDAVIACANSPLPGPANELSCFGRTRAGRQQIDGRLNAATTVRIERAQLAFSGWRNTYGVSHTRPRSALTSSQGIGSC